MNSSNNAKITTAALSWLATAGYMALIYFLSSRHLHMPSMLPDYFDKLAHVMLYMPLAFLFFVSLRKSGLDKYVFLISILMAGVYGITDELHQSFVPGRYASASDVFADFIGAVLGSLGASRIKG